MIEGYDRFVEINVVRPAKYGAFECDRVLAGQLLFESTYEIHAPGSRNDNKP
jgi:hypothetical protein